MIIPKKMFLTKGMGIHKDKLFSFELALREAGIEKFNLVSVSSIVPPKCQLVSKEEGLKFLKPGQILFCVLAKTQTNIPNLPITSAIGIALPKEEGYGYVYEYHCSGKRVKHPGVYAQRLAAEMLATAKGKKGLLEEFTTFSIYQSAKGNKDGLWTTVISVAGFIV